VWDDQIGHVFLDGLLRLMGVAVVGSGLPLLLHLWAHGLLLWPFRVAKLDSQLQPHKNAWHRAARAAVPPTSSRRLAVLPQYRCRPQDPVPGDRPATTQLQCRPKILGGRPCCAVAAQGNARHLQGSSQFRGPWLGS
jgi:hypothetical protein